jgi:hypothetical protein
LKPVAPRIGKVGGTAPAPSKAPAPPAAAGTGTGAARVVPPVAPGPRPGAAPAAPIAKKRPPSFPPEDEWDASDRPPGRDAERRDLAAPPPRAPSRPGDDEITAVNSAVAGALAGAEDPDATRPHPPPVMAAGG